VSRSRDAASAPDTPEADPTAPPVLALIGPTAAGKTQIALEVAPGLCAEIVGVDSMQIYRGMDIGTAKPGADERARVPHHMIDIADPAHPYSVAQFQRAARAAIAGIASRGRVPLIVGGSGLYFRAVVDDLKFPPTDDLVRARVAADDPERLLERLRSVDPSSAARIEPANIRRVVRALEVLELTGEPFSAFRASWDEYESRYDLVVAGLRLEPALLDERIEPRTRAMFEAGLIDEVRGLLDLGLRRALTASRAIAYREAVAHLDGELTLDEAIAATAGATRRFARRQMTWFRKDPRIRWFDAESSEHAAREVAAYFAAQVARRA
jgi:tRNA dimethylallyltransferase